MTAEAFYDVGIKRSRIQFDMLTYFNEYDYQINVSNSMFDNSNNGGLISLSDGSSNVITTSVTLGFPFTIDGSNNTILIAPKSSVPGLSLITTPYTIEFPYGSYRTKEVLQRAINDVFSKIQGLNDDEGIALNGLNMSQSRVEITDTTFTFYYYIINKLTQDDYTVELTDTIGGVAYTDYENNYYDITGNERYSIESTVDASGITTLSYSDPDASGSGVPSGITGNSWDALLGFTELSYSLLGSQREIIGSRDIMYDISKTIMINETELKNNTLFFTPQSSVKGLTDASGVKKIEIDVPDGIYNIYGLYNTINNRLRDNPQTNNSILYSTFDKGTEYSVFQMCINQKYTAEDYILSFYDRDAVELQNIQTITTNSFQTTTWDVTIGWLLGYHTLPQYDLNSLVADENNYADTNKYTINDDTKIVTIQGDACLDLYLFKNLYLIVDDFTQNHLNDGLITGIRSNPNAEKPSYASSATRVCNPLTKHNQASIFNASQPGMGLTEKQIYAANQIGIENKIKNSTKLYSDPPYVKDMFALIPIKVSGLSQGEVFTEYGGTMQDNDRKYFGPVNITKLRIQLLNDHGDVINLNGNNWSFSLIFEYLYNMKGV